MSFTPRSVREKHESWYTPHRLQKRALVLMMGLVVFTFMASNLTAVLWQASDWLVSTVLPAVVVDLTNQERNTNAVPELRRNAVLDEAARLKAEHMAREQYFAHYSPSGVTPWHWFAEVGYTFVHAGENLAIHFTDSSAVVRAWMNSPTHRANIVNRQFTEIGVGTARGRYQGYDTIYVVQLFGTPAAAVQPPPVEPVPESEPEPETLAQDNGTSTALTATTTDVVLVAESEAGPATELPEPASEPIQLADQEDEPATALASNEEVTETPTSAVLADEATGTSSLANDESGADVTVFDTEVTRIEQGQLTYWLSGMHTTSTGLVAASAREGTLQRSPSYRFASLATRPNSILQTTYAVLSVGVMAMLVYAALFEAKRRRFVQVAYSGGLLVAMGGLWYVHVTVTSGAVVV